MFKLNDVLHTRDGRKIGNAIIVKANDVRTYDIKTDYGNVVSNLTIPELLEYFYNPHEDYFGKYEAYLNAFPTNHKYHQEE